MERAKGSYKEQEMNPTKLLSFFDRERGERKARKKQKMTHVSLESSFDRGGGQRR